MTDISNTETSTYNNYFEEINSIFKRPELQIKLYYRYYYFNSEPLKRWISDYYKFQSNLIISNYYSVNNEPINMIVPSSTGALSWNVRDIPIIINYDWTGIHHGEICLGNTVLKGIYDRLKFLYDNKRKVFDLIFSTKYKFEFEDNYKIVVRCSTNKNSIDIRVIKTLFFGDDEECSVNETRKYLESCNYISIDELGTELTHLTNSIYGITYFMMRCGIEFDTSDDEQENHIINVINEDNTLENDDEKQEEDSDFDTFVIFIKDEQPIISGFNLYPVEKFSIDDTESKRNTSMNLFSDIFYKINNGMNTTMPKYIINYNDLKEITAKLHFNNNIKQYNEFIEKYRDTGILYNCSSIMEVSECCESFKNGNEFVNGNKESGEYKIVDPLISNLFSFIFNDSTNESAKKVKSNTSK